MQDLKEMQEEVWWDILRRMNENPDLYKQMFITENFGE